MNRTLAALALATLVSGCFVKPQEPSDPMKQYSCVRDQDTPRLQCQPLLTSKEWIVEDLDQQGVIDNSRASLNFSADGRVSGNSSCNRFFANYALHDNRLEIKQAATTMMACPEALMRQERRFLNALENVERLEIDATGALILSGKGHRILAR